VGTLNDLQEEVTPEQAAELLRDREAQLLDVREPYEHEAGRIEGATRVDLEGLGQIAPGLDPDRPVVLYCRSGARSAVASQAFRAAGFEAYNVTGGLLAWQRSGLPIEPDGGTVADH
jgi:rhodanese-related sulfurtransferase